MDCDVDGLFLYVSPVDLYSGLNAMISVDLCFDCDWEYGNWSPLCFGLI